MFQMSCNGKSHLVNRCGHTERKGRHPDKEWEEVYI